ncbi:putative transporter [Rhodocollybia butyracea]|uniref:Quinate transporter n=1 Tax=Rhodocollybia butyracea TaxID=206335 RepID=A0A9P5Q5U6_9AGAR|nr:putative transporter [Rhodocollybia butyracea]
MVALTKVEDRPTPPEVYNWKVYAYSIAAAFGAMLYGYDSAFIGGTIALASFQEEFGITAHNSAAISANIVSGYQAGAFFGALLSFPFCERFGRKWTLLLAAVFFDIGAILHLVPTAHTGLAPLYIGRVVGGLGVGAISLVTPIYIAEISPPAIRGRLVGLYEMLLQIGGLLGFWINYAVSETLPANRTQWLIPMAIQLIPGGLLFFLTFALIETPRWLRSKGRIEEADRNLSRIRGLSASNTYILEENAMTDAQLAVEANKSYGGSFSGRLRELFLPGVRNRLLMCFILFLFQNGTGINAINYYSPTVFKSIGIAGTNTGLFTTGIFGIVKNIATAVWLLFLIDRFGRRPLLIIGAIVAGFCMLYIGGEIAIGKPTGTANITKGGISAVAFIYIWTAAYGPTWNGTPWVITAEIFPQHVRTLAQSLLSASQWIWQFVIARATPYMFNSMGYGTYLFFGLLTLVGGVYVYFFVPETAQVPIEKMDEIFGFGPPSNIGDVEENSIRSKGEVTQIEVTPT